jgi:hypothetical protein
MIRVIALTLVCSASCFAADTTDLMFDSWFSAELYGSHYSTSRGRSDFHDLLNFAPGDDLGLNNIFLGVRATSSRLFGALTLQYGDIPRSGWDPDQPWLQEAWLGYHLTEDIDVTAGAFTTALGVESLMSYENYSGIVSVPGFFDPGFYSGVQMTWKASSVTTVNTGVVSSFSDFSITGNIPSLSIGLTYVPQPNCNVSLQTLISEEQVDVDDQYQLYTSMTGILRRYRMHFLTELNFCYEFANANNTASSTVSGLVGVYYDVTSSLQTGLRLEAMYDPDGALADSRFDKPLPYNTLSMAGVTGTITYRPSSWSIIRADARYIGVLDNRSFIEIEPDSRKRAELVLSTDVYFLGLFQR